MNEIGMRSVCTFAFETSCSEGITGIIGMPFLRRVCTVLQIIRHLRIGSGVYTALWVEHIA